MVIVYKFEANCQLCKVSGVRQVSDRGKNTVKAEILAYLYLMVLPTNIKKWAIVHCFKLLRMAAEEVFNSF